MSRIFHIVPQTTWNQVAGTDYRADSLASEGFAHCSYSAQVAPVVQRFFAGQTGLLLLEIDVAKLRSELRAEEVGGEKFPHVYGPIEREAIVKVWVLEDWLSSRET